MIVYYLHSDEDTLDITPAIKIIYVHRDFHPGKYKG